MFFCILFSEANWKRQAYSLIHVILILNRKDSEKQKKTNKKIDNAVDEANN